MMLKGMPKTIIDEACALYAEDITAWSDDSLIRQIQKFISLGVNPVDIYTKLARKGYNFDQIKKAILVIS
jgi:SOS response regulatory protein OraA/RecX